MQMQGQQNLGGAAATVAREAKRVENHLHGTEIELSTAAMSSAGNT